jgi:hypothetical protein
MAQIIYLKDFEKNALKKSYEPIKKDFVTSVSKNYKKRKNAVTVLTNLNMAKIMYFDFLKDIESMFNGNDDLETILINHCYSSIKYINKILSRLDTE